MRLKSNNKLFNCVLIISIVFIVFITLLAIVFKDRLFLLAALPFILMIFQWWIAFCREIQLTEDGCIVKFLNITKLYRWNQLKTKRRQEFSIGQLELTYNGILLSCRREHHVYRIPTVHPFSLIFVFFEPNLAPRTQLPHWAPKWLKQGPEQGIVSGYFADEEQLFFLLNSWGVTLDE